MFRVFFWGILLCAVGVHLGHWRREFDASHRLCESLDGKTVDFRGSFYWTGVRSEAQGGEIFFPVRRRFSGMIFLEKPKKSHGPVRIQGLWRCLKDARNPSTESDRIRFWRPARAIIHKVREKSKGVSLRGKFANRFEMNLENHPIGGLIKAVWLGDLSSLPPHWPDVYREAGLVHVLALSGQHVLSLFLFIKVVLMGVARLAVRQFAARRVFRLTLHWVPLACAVLLASLNPDNESMVRAFWVLCAAQLIRLLRLQVSPLQIVGTTGALSLMSDPSRFASASFVLSLIAAAVLCLLMENRRVQTQGIGLYFYLSFWMPLCVAPVIAFYFGKFSPMAALNGIAFGWLWGLVWIPLGFVSGIAALLPAGIGSGLLQGAQTVWVGYSSLQAGLESWMRCGYQTTLRPTAWELGVLVAFLVGICRRKAAKASLRQNLTDALQ